MPKEADAGIAAISPVTGSFEQSRPPRYLQLAFGILVIGAVFCWLQFSTPGICCGDFDGYYHIKWSQLLWNGLRHADFPPTFTWLPLTTLSPSHYADQHFLFHILLIPFTWIGDLRLGAKLAAALFGTVAVASVYWLILRYRISYPLLWLLALLGCSWMFYARLNMTKAQSLSLFFMVVGIVLLLERKYIWLWPAAFLYVWAYNLFVLLGLLALIWVAVLWWSEHRLEWRPLLWTGLGMATGFLINPFFPHNVSLFLEHLIAKSGQLSMPSGVGFEWYSLSSWDFLKTSLLACLAMLLGYIGFGYLLALSRSDRTRVQRPLLFLLFSTALLLIAIRSVRFMEYWPPFAVLFAAFTLHAVWHSQAVAAPLNSPESIFEKEGSAQSRAPRLIAPSTMFETLPLAMLLAAVAFYNLHVARTTMQHITVDPSHYRAGTEWLRDNVPPGALIYNLNWSDFPKLFFYDTTHSYVSGLDPLYLGDQHPELAQLNLRLSRRKEEHPGAAIRSLFDPSDPLGVTFLFVGDVPAPPSREWLDYIRQAREFDVVYEDQECMVLHLRQ